VGGAAGFVVRAPYTSGFSCTPFNSEFGLIETNCPTAGVDLFWTVLLGFPRLTLAMPAIALAFFKAALLHGTVNWALEGGVWLLYSIPFLFIIWQGVRFWKVRNVAFALFIGITTIVEFVALGFLE
jgi:hypothetical protein